MITSHRLSAALAIGMVLSLCACAPGSIDQGHLESAAEAVVAPESSKPLDAATKICTELSEQCGDPAVIATWSPVDGIASATEYCRSFLTWAGEMGVTKVWVQRELDWRGWYEPTIHAMVNSGRIPTGAVDAEQTLVDCSVAVSRTLAPLGPDDQRVRFDVVGITGVPGVAGGLVVARLMPPRSIENGALRDTGEPYMFVAYFMLI
jgi:hypothetical protein